MGLIKEAKDIKMCVVGYSGLFNMGELHFSEAQRAGITPCAVVEIDPERREAAKKKRPDIEVYESVDDMLKTSDANLITLITPHNTHAELAIKCLNKGRNVVCEKPFAITTQECDDMIAAAAKHKAMLSTYHNRHWDGCILKAYNDIKSGIIGDIVRVEIKMGGYNQPADWWRSSKSISGGILYDWGVHLLEYSLQIIDSDILEVAGYAKNGFWADKCKYKEDTNEDEAYANVRFANGVWLSLMISSIDVDSDTYWIKVTGTKGVYKFNHATWETIIPQNGVTVRTTGPSPASESHLYYQNIADHLVKGEALVITPEWARRPIHIIDLAVKSAKANANSKAIYP